MFFFFSLTLSILPQSFSSSQLHFWSPLPVLSPHFSFFNRNPVKDSLQQPTGLQLQRVSDIPITTNMVEAFSGELKVQGQGEREREIGGCIWACVYKSEREREREREREKENVCVCVCESVIVYVYVRQWERERKREREREIMCFV